MRVFGMMLVCGLYSSAALAGGVVVLQSDTLAPYEAAVEAFEVGLGQDVRVYNLRGDRERAVAVAHQLQKARPELVFAVGEKAAWTASNLLSDVPQVFAQVKDPQRFGMIRKIHSLQKQLIGKTEEVVEKDLLIQEKEKLYVELKNILARQPGPEVAEQLSVYQQNLKEKTRQMKAMASELNMYQDIYL